MADSNRFAARLLQWFDAHGRKDLPWQQNRTAYRVWVAEIMLQQTQVATVIPYYERFIARFPDVQTLAAAGLDDVLHHWSGLGYYARGRNLYTAAVRIVEESAGQLPTDFEQLLALPGIGRSTAGAILAQACNQRHAILDGNVKRVLARYFAVAGWPGNSKVSQQLWQHAEALTPQQRVADYTQAIMDLGATLCTRSKPACPLCPVSSACQAFKQNRTSQYPGSKPKRDIPLRTVQMVILHDSRSQLLLQRRPPTGVWGGLLSFPELAPEEDAQRWCEEKFGPVEPQPALQPLLHTFSHFRLKILPISLRLLNDKPQIMSADSWVWYRPDHSKAGLAAPVSKLIQRFSRQTEALELTG